MVMDAIFGTILGFKHHLLEGASSGIVVFSHSNFNIQRDIWRTIYGCFQKWGYPKMDDL